MKKLCIMHRASIGDMLLATPVHRAVKETFPQCKLTVVTSPTGFELMNGSPYIDKLISYKKGDSVFKVFKNIWRADAAVIFDYSYRNALMAFLAAIPKRIGRGKNFINFKIAPYPTEMFEPLKYLDMVKILGIHTENFSLVRPVATAAEKLRVKKLCAEIKNVGQKLILIAPYSLSPLKDWRVENYHEIISRLQKYGHVVAIIGGKNERERIEKNFPNIRNFAGETNLRESTELISQADLQICGCSSTLHLCSTTNTPSIAIYGPSSPAQWAPRKNCTVISRNVNCSPCYNVEGKSSCEERSCLNSISVEEVWSAVKKSLGGSNGF